MNNLANTLLTLFMDSLEYEKVFGEANPEFPKAWYTPTFIMIDNRLAPPEWFKVHISELTEYLKTGITVTPPTTPELLIFLHMSRDEIVGINDHEILAMYALALSYVSDKLNKALGKKELPVLEEMSGFSKEGLEDLIPKFKINRETMETIREDNEEDKNEAA